jgi:FMN phosphatase YigB (HAD superfamily)
VADTLEIVFLFDVDNTLLDNDRFRADLGAQLERCFGAEQRDRYWSIYDALRDEVSYADYLGALNRFRIGLDDDPDLLQMSSFLLDYPFAERVYDGALDALAHVRRWGLTAILSDGDIAFQPRKIQRAGLWDAVEGRVLVTVHKERALDAMRLRFPARHYAIVDDKPNLLAAMKTVMGNVLTTVFVRQGHYAMEATHETIDPAPDVGIERIGDLLALERSGFFLN